METERTWEISDIDGGNRRRVTLAQYRAELDAARPYTQAIAGALKRGDMQGVENAQDNYRRAVREGIVL